MQNLHFMPAHQLHKMRLAGEISTADIVAAVVDQIEAAESRVQAFLYKDLSGALERAEAVDHKLQSGDPVGLWEGMPISVKDIFATRGIPTTTGSKMLAGYVAPYESTVTQKLQEAGCNLVGKNNLDEFAMGGSTENSAFQTTRNPIDLERVPGGSSGGSAAAVAAGMSLASIGTDTGGSVRQPAALTGMVGVKPTYGRVSRFGITAFASSLEQAGPITRDVADAASILQIISGHDPQDATSRTTPVPDFSAELGQDLKGLKIGRITDLDTSACTPAVQENFEQVLKKLQEAGAQICDVQMPNLRHAIAAYYVIAPAEACSNLGRFDGIRYGHRAEHENLLDLYERSRDEGFGPEVKLRILTGTFVLSSGYYDAYYGKAQQVQALLRKQFAQNFAQVDLIATPVSPEPAFKIGAKTADPITMYLMDAFTIPANLAGIPAISVPSGMDQQGLPLGVQFLAAADHETRLFRAARTIEELMGYRYPTPQFTP